MGLLAHPGERLRAGQADRVVARRVTAACRSRSSAGARRSPTDALTNADLEARRRHERRLDRRAHRHPRAAHRRARRDHGDARRPRPRPTRSSAPASSPTDIDLLSSRPRHARHADAAHRRVRRRGARAALRFVRPERRVRGLRLRAGGRRVAAATPATTTCSIVGAETLSRITDPEDRGTVILFGDGAGGGRARAARPATPGLLAWDLGCDGSAAGAASRSPPAAAGCPASAETVADARPLHEDAGPGGVPAGGARRRRLEHGHARARRRRRRRRRVVRAAPGEPAHHRSRGQAARLRARAHASPTSSATATRRRRRSRSRCSRRSTTAACSDGDLVLCSGFGAGHDVGQRAAPLGHA